MRCLANISLGLFLSAVSCGSAKAEAREESVAGSPVAWEQLIFEDFGLRGGLREPPGFSVTAERWIANRRLFSDGMALQSKDGGASMAGISFDEGYFSAHPGIYELSMDVYFPEGSGDAKNAFGIGFTPKVSGGSNVHFGRTETAGQPCMALRADGSLVVRAEPDKTIYSADAGSFPGGTPRRLQLVLDTTGEKWKVRAFVDYRELDLAGSGGPGAFVYEQNPVIRCVALVMSSNLGPAAFVYNFSLRRQVPEKS